jgi:hypothetical protein
MAYTVPAVNATGLDALLLEVTTQVPIFTPMLLVFIFCIVLITGYTRQKKESGNGDAPLWATIAGIATSVIALILSTRTGLISLGVLVVTIVITIFCGIWLISSEDRQ